MYQFDDCGVCTNPDTIELARFSRIELCEYNGKWFYGMQLDYVSGGMGFACNIKYNPCATRKEARDNAFKDAIRHIEEQIGWYTRAVENSDGNGGYRSSLKQCHVLMKILKDKQVQKAQPIQLSLFDF